MMSTEYQIVSAFWAEADNSVVMIETSNFGQVCVPQRDRPELWDDVMTWAAAGGVITPYQPEPEPLGMTVAEDEGMTIV